MDMAARCLISINVLISSPRLANVNRFEAQTFLAQLSHVSLVSHIVNCPIEAN